MPPFGFEPTIPASQRPQAYALDRAVTGTGNSFELYLKFKSVPLTRHTTRRTHYKNQPVNDKLPQENFFFYVYVTVRR
jgi:hypothetical protein